jgi:glycosyltransferase involved in cell wall biosynthesis
MIFVWLVVPVYSEEVAIRLFLRDVFRIFAEIESVRLELIFVNDGSQN